MFVTEGQAISDYIGLKDFDFDNCLIYVNGYQKDKDYILKKDDVCTVRQFASGATGALITAGVIATVSLGGIVVGAVSSSKKDDLSQLETTVDTVGSSKQTESVPSISGASNSSQYGKPYPFVMGKHLYTPMYLGKPYTTIGGTDGEDEYFHGLYLLGYNDIDAYNFSLGTNLIASNEYTEIDKKNFYAFNGVIREHFDSKKTVYTKSEEQINLNAIVDNCTIYALVPSDKSSGELTIRASRKGYLSNERNQFFDDEGNVREEINEVEVNNIDNLIEMPNMIVSNVDSFDYKLYTADFTCKYTPDDLIPLYQDGVTYYGIPIKVNYDLNVNGMNNYDTLKSYLSVNLFLVWNELHQEEHYPVRKGDVFIDGRYSDCQIELQDKDEVGLYPQKVTQEDLNIELTNIELEDSNKSDLYLTSQRFSASYPQKVEVEFTVNGLTDSTNNKSAEIIMCVEYSTNGGQSWNSMSIDDWTSCDRPSYNYASSMKNSNSWGQCYKLERNKNKVMRFVATKEFKFSDVMRFNSESGKYENSLTNNVVEFRIRRANKCLQVAQSGVLDKIFLTAIRTWSYDYNRSVESNSLVIQRPMIEKDRVRTTRVGFKIKANEDLDGNLESFNCIVQSRGRYCTVSGSGDNKVYKWSAIDDVIPTRNPASIALLALQSCMRGNYVYDDSRIDMESFGRFYEWCASKGYYTGKYVNEERFCCDGVLTNQKKTRDILNDILSCGRGSLVLNGKKYGVMIDCQKDTPSLVLNNQNIISSYHKKLFTDLPDGYNSSFINEENRWSEDDCSVYMDESNRVNANATDLKMEKIALPYQTRWCQVWANLRFELAKLKLRPEAWFETVGLEGNLAELGDIISVQTDTLLVGIGDGAEIKELVYDFSKTKIIGIKCDGSFDVDDEDADYGVVIQHYSDFYEPTVIKRKVYFDGTTNIDTLYFTDAIDLRETPEGKKLSVGDIVSFGLYGKEVADTICLGKKSNKDGTFELTLVPYTSDLYLVDTYDKESGKIADIPEFDSKVTTPFDLKDGNPNVTQAQLNEITRQIITKVADSVKYLYNSITITLYKESSKQLTDEDLPSCNAIYSFADDTFVFDDDVEANGWSRVYPSNHTNPIYITSATAFGKNSTDIISANEWASPIVSGNDGINGYNTHTINLYKRAEQKPTDYPDSLIYHFDTGMLVASAQGNSFYGWSTSIPSVVNSNGDVWEIHATALSTTLEDEILNTDWSEPCQITANVGLTEKEIKDMIQDGIEQTLDKPKVELDAYGATFYVNSEGYTTVSQQVEYLISITQANENLAFDVTDVKLPKGFSFKLEDNKLTIYVSKGVRVGTGFFDITLAYKFFKSSYVIGYEKDDASYFLCFTGEGEEGIPDSEVNEIAIGFQTEASEGESKTVRINYNTITGNKYLGGIKTLDEVAELGERTLMIGDYFTFIGDTIASDLAQEGNFVNCKIYTYVGTGNSWDWEVDTDTTHLSGAMTDIFAVANEELRNNNSTAFMYLDKLVSNKVFTDLLVANDAFIKNLVTSKIMVEKDNALRSELFDKIGSVSSFNTDILNVLGFKSEQELKDFYIVNGKTIIEGGYIKTNLIESDVFKSKYASIDYLTGGNAKFTGTIEGSRIKGSSIESTVYDPVNGKGFRLNSDDGSFVCYQGRFHGSIESGPLTLNLNPSTYHFVSDSGMKLSDFIQKLKNEGCQNKQKYSVIGMVNNINYPSEIEIYFESIPIAYTVSYSTEYAFTYTYTKNGEQTNIYRVIKSEKNGESLRFYYNGKEINGYIEYERVSVSYSEYKDLDGAVHSHGTPNFGYSSTDVKPEKVFSHWETVPPSYVGGVQVFPGGQLPVFVDSKPKYITYAEFEYSHTNTVKQSEIGACNFRINPSSYSLILTNLPKSPSNTKGAVYASDDGILRISM